MEGEIARWRIAYDTISALVAVDQRRTELLQAPQPITAAAAGRGGGMSCAAGAMSSHRDNGRLIQQQQQQQRHDVTHQSSGSTAFNSLQFHNVQSNQSNIPLTTALLSGSSHFRSAAQMTSLCGVAAVTNGIVDEVLERQLIDGQRNDAARLVHNGEVLVSLFRRLLDTFYIETLLWMYSNVLLHPAARRTRNRLHWLGVVTGRSIEQAASNVLTGFLAGYRQSRQAVISDVEETLMTTGSGRAARLAGLAVELGVVLNPRQMIRSFSAVVRDLVFRTSFEAVLINSSSSLHAGGLYRYESGRSCHRHQLHQRGTWYADTGHVSSTRGHHHGPGRVYYHPPPPPPYPGFLLHFLSVLEDTPVLQPLTSSPADASISDSSSYEELLRLSEELGEVKERGLKLDDVQQLPYYHVSGSHNAHSVHVCVICLDEFTSGQMIRALPCCHEYHAKCIDRWLTINRTCPMCRYDIDPESIQSTTTV